MNTEDKEILVKALEKARKNGMKGVCSTIRVSNGDPVEKDEIYDGYYESIILSKEFAKAFFGKGSSWLHEVMVSASKQHEVEAMKQWEMCLQQMILSDNRIAYLKKFL
jgi:hypothetical protein